MKKEVKDYTPEQLEAFARIKKACVDLNYEQTDEVMNYCESEAYYFCGKRNCI